MAEVPRRICSTEAAGLHLLRAARAAAARKSGYLVHILMLGGICDMSNAQNKCLIGTINAVDCPFKLLLSDRAAFV